MNIRLTYLGLLATASAGISTVAISASAHALSLSGTFNFGGDVNISEAPSGSGNFRFDFLSAGSTVPTPGTAGDINVGAGQGSFAGSGEVASGAKIKDFSTLFGNPDFPVAPIENFITGIELSSGKVLSFDLTEYSTVLADTFRLSGPNSGIGFNSGEFSGVFRDSSGAVTGNGSLTAQFATPDITGQTFYSASLRASEVPTPALLPGLVGMGVAALRKRGSSKEEDIKA